MTDTTGGRGGVGIRLFVSGGEVVKRTFDQVGDSGKKMWAEIALGEKAANPAVRAMSRASNEAQESVQGLAARTGAAGNVLSAFGATGVVVAAGIGAMAVALMQARGAMQFADEIDDAAQKLNIGTDALQEYRFAMTEVGGATTDADSALEGFQKKLGEAMAGGRSVKWFERLGIGKEQLRDFKSTEEALDLVIDRVSGLATEAERAAISEKLGLGPMIPLIREGGDAIDALREKAQDLGIVMDAELISRAADANQEFETLSKVVDIQLKSAFVDLAPALVTAIGLIAEMATALSDAMDAWRDLDNRTARGLRDERTRVISERDLIVDAFGTGSLNGRPVIGRPVAGQTYRNELPVSSMRNAPRLPSAEFDPTFGMGWGLNAAEVPKPRPQYMDAGEHFDALNRRILQIDRELASRAPSNTPGGGNRLPDAPSTPRGGGAGSAAREAERLAREAERARERLAQETTRAERDAVRARHSGDTAEDRLQLATEMLRLDRQERDAKRAALTAELERTGVTDEASRAQIDALTALDAEADLLAERAILEENRKDLAEQTLRRDQAREDDALALLDIESQLATTRQEQYAIERRILILRQAAERRALEAELNADESLSEAEKASRLGGADYRNRLQLGLFDDTERSRAQAEFRSFGHEIIEGVKSGKLGQHIADEMQARLIDMALNGLFDFLNPRGADGKAYGPQGGGSSIWKMGLDVLASVFGGGSPTGPGRAGGGGLMRGYRHPVAETGRPELMMIGGNGHVTDAVTTQRMLQDLMETGGGGGANGGRSVTQHNHSWDLRGAVVTEDLLRQMDAKAAAAERRAVGRSLDASRKAAPGMQARMRQLGTT